jgi:hypothetical protein
MKSSMVFNEKYKQKFVWDFGFNYISKLLRRNQNATSCDLQLFLF